MQIFKHITQQPFIFATGLAALIHSTWSLGTLFAGQAPETALSPEFMGWLIPALLIAFAMDVGQISTSEQIRERGMNMARGTTFFVFAFATYYLQWLYIAHHMPLLALGDGISPLHRDAAIALRDAGMWIIPALLPLSTLLYTFSGEHQAPEIKHPVLHESITIETPQKPLIQASLDKPELMPELEEDTEPLNSLTCECGWQTGMKESMDKAKRSLRVHQTMHCELNKADVS